MRFYTYGDAAKAVILLIPGTCCHHSVDRSHGDMAVGRSVGLPVRSPAPSAGHVGV